MKPTLNERLRSSLPLIYLVIALFALRWTIVEPYVVPTPSMEPTLKMGDRLYALKCAYDVRFPFTNWILFRTGTVKKGDIILFQSPHKPDLTFVKRALGVEGDIFEMRNGLVFVNGEQVVREPAKDSSVMYDIERKEEKTLYIENTSGIKHYMILDHGQPLNRDFGPTTIPKGYVLAIGDNRDNSSDSRSWGFVPLENLKGRAMFIWFSSRDWVTRPERIGTLLQ